MPISTLPWEYQLMFWIFISIIVSLLAVSLFFLRRYIVKQDDGLSSVKITQVNMNEKLQDFQDKTNSKFSELKEKLSSTLSNIKYNEAEFQQDIGKDLIEIKKASVNIEQTLDRTNKKAEQLEEKINNSTIQTQNLYAHIDKQITYANENINNLKSKTDKHDKLFTIEHEILKAQEKKINEIRTKVTRIGKNTVIIGSKKPKE